PRRAGRTCSPLELRLELILVELELDRRLLAGETGNGNYGFTGKSTNRSAELCSAHPRPLRRRPSAQSLAAHDRLALADVGRGLVGDGLEHRPELVLGKRPLAERAHDARRELARACRLCVDRAKAARSAEQSSVHDPIDLRASDGKVRLLAAPH